jgi:hypothetical protein
MQRRFIYNCDGDNLFIYDQPPMTADQVRARVDEIDTTAVTTFYMCPNMGMNMNFPSRVADMVGTHVRPDTEQRIERLAPTSPASAERAVANLRALVAAGHDPFGLVIDRARALGMETFVTFRLNEVHAVEDPDSLLLSRFWRDHPQWRVGAPGQPLPPLHLDILGPNVHPIVGTWLPGALNFGVPEVREQRLAELRECCERYPVDGLDLDFQRFPMYFPPGSEADHVETMTAWMGEVREMTREVGRKRGRPLLLSARVMARPQQSLALGLDVATWAREGMLDFVIVSHYLRNDFALPVAAYRRLLPANMPLYASIEVEQTPDAYRRIARRLWRDGVDGLTVFNFFTFREGGKEPPFALLRELNDPSSGPGGPE